jgi:TolB-like protein/Tfp pilus assembly protein PilF
MLSDNSDQRLDSWKSIAAYLKRDKRTIQRWEHEGLPIHRKLHDKLSSVFAYRSELDKWWEGSRNPSAAAQPEHSLPRRPLLAVLPLRNLSGNSDEEFFSDGLTEELISQLSRINPAELGVIARGSTMKYKGSAADVNRIARELGAAYLLDGSVRRSNNRVRIAVQLIEVSDSGHLWADSYDRDLSDILQLQDEVGAAVTSQIAGQLVTRKQGGLHGRRLAPAAYEAYLRGRVLWSQRSNSALTRAVDFFEQSISIDSSYAPAYAGLADSYTSLASMAHGEFKPSEAMPKAKTAASRALELEPRLAEANASLALIELFYGWDWPRAAALFERALKLNAGYGTDRQWYAEYLGSAGRIAEALRELLTAQELDPLSLAISGAVASIHYLNRNYDEAIALSRRTLETEPGFVLATLNLARAYEQKRMYRQAIGQLTEARERHPDSTTLLMALGRAFASSGKVREARQILTSLKRLGRKRYVPAFHFAAIHAALGESEQTFTWLQRAREERCDYLVYLDQEPAADKIRHDPRYAAIVPHAPNGAGVQP